MRTLTSILLVLLFSSCGFLNRNDETSDEVVARVEDAYLYKKDLDGLVPPGTAPEDSVEKVKAFVDDWVRQTLLLKKAELNLSSEMKNFEKQLENYRKSLIIYTYQEMLISQQLDTVVSDAEIQAYYDEHPADFELRKNILKASYVVFMRSSKERDKVKKWFMSDKEDHREKLQEFCYTTAFKYNMNDTSWMFMDELEKDVPVKYSSQEMFLASRRFVEFEDSSLVYLLKIHDYKIKQSISPLEFEKSRIASIIINIRKKELLRRAEEDIYREAVETSKFETFVQ